MNENNFTYAVVLTSCGRFDLLRKTVESFLQYADIPPTQFIIIEDSGDDKVRDAVAGLEAPFEFIINRLHLGQAASIDTAYAQVKTSYIFHCEDDWEFFRTGFIAESLLLLEAFPKISGVMLRGYDEYNKLCTLPMKELNGVRFFFAKPFGRCYFGCSYNPGLRRLADYKRVAPLAEIGNEESVSLVFSLLGYTTAHLVIPATCHIGWEQHTQDALRKPKNKFRKLRRKIQHWQWQKFGLPTKWRD